MFMYSEWKQKNDVFSPLFFALCRKIQQIHTRRSQNDTTLHVEHKLNDRRI